MASANNRLKKIIILTFVLSVCITSVIAAPPGKSIWNADPSSSSMDEDTNAIWDEGNAFDLDDDSSLNPPRGLSQKGWFDDDLTSHLEDIDDANQDDDNRFDDSDESFESDEGDPEEELVIEGIDEEDHAGSQKPENTKDLVDDTLKLRHGGHSRLEDDIDDGDEDDDDELPEEVGNLQSLDKLPDDSKQGDDVLLGTYNMLSSYSNGEDESDENDLDDDDDDSDGDDESDEDDNEDESNSVFSDPEDKEQKIFEDRVLMF